MTRKMDLLNTQQYLLMRHEAFKNDGTTPGSSDYDINGTWDTTRYTDWQKELIGGTAHITDVQVSFSGGNTNVQFFIGGNYRKETTVFPGNFGDQKASTHLSLTNISDNKRFNLTFSASYLSDNNNLPQTDLSSYALSLPPDAPSAFDGNGGLNWPSGFDNPYAYLKQRYKGDINNLIANALIGYVLIPSLQLKANFGYSKTETNEKNISPLSSFNPAYGATSGNSRFGKTNIKNWIAEPQAEYKTNIFGGNLTALLGTSFQEEIRQDEVLDASGFSTDELLENLGAASKVTVRFTNYTLYRYNGVFGRINYNKNDKYLINLTARRDGSSRFGPRKQFANFGAIGTGWIFSNEKFVKDNFLFLSYGKLRFSYGAMGSDQIPDYGFLDTYTPTSLPYQGNSIIPTRLANSDYSWEKTRKLELGLEIGLLKDRILFSTNWYRNRSSNQLVGYPLPLITGFSSIQYNLPAVVENTGLEMQLTTTNLEKAKMSWTTSINFTIPQNKLISYPNLAASSYANTYEVGKSLFIQKLFHYVNVDPQNGIYGFESISNRTTTSIPDYPGDLKSSKKITQDYYGGIENNFKWKGWQLSILFQMAKQTGFNYWYGSYISPGMMMNQPRIVLRRWQKPGDQTNFEQFTQDFGSAAYNSYNVGFSDYAISDASFIRLKNLYVSHVIPDKWKKNMHIQNGIFYLEGQNLFTITKYLGLDPESQIVAYLPPLWMLTGGIQLTF
ncbi:MAG TPA: SusC/RagA family TonB-linked outer membrane protein [Chitinophagaceae bacterium]|nr:SusC/RagA family TonB-linked outer membrane protein [Chitinophagaceae bacterium]